MHKYSKSKHFFNLENENENNSYFYSTYVTIQ